MFKIIESISMDPIRLPMCENISFFRPGFICKIIDHLYCDVSDGNSVFGILGERFDHTTKVNDHEIRLQKFVNVYTQRMIFRTNEYMFGDYYKSGAKLYVNNRGLLTVKEPYKDAVYYGRVISPPNVDRQYMEALWI
jgi:hypothetical protein